MADRYGPPRVIPHFAIHGKQTKFRAKTWMDWVRVMLFGFFGLFTLRKELDIILMMSKTQILEELPKLSPGERTEVFNHLCAMQEDDLLQGAVASGNERLLLDQELADFARDQDMGKPWREVMQALRVKRAS